MVYHTGPKIVTDGLVCCLDAADRNSYPLSGGTWYDLSGNGHNGTLQGDTVYSNSNNGSMYFDGTGDYISNSNIISLSEYTLSIWINRTGIQSSSYPTLIAFGSYSPGFYLEFGGNGYVSYYRSGISNQTFFPKSDITTNTWHNIVFTKSSDNTITSYLNGVSKISRSDSISTSSAGFGLNADRNTAPNSTTHWEGNIANFLVYNRALSADEVRRNYNATKGRFGL